MSRTVIYKDCFITVPKDGSDGKLYYNNQPIDMIDMIDELIKLSKKGKNIEVFVSYLGFDHQYMTILNVLNRLGYTAQPDISKNDMRKGDMRFRIGEKSCYFVQFKTGAHNYVTMQCVDSVIGLKDIPETTDQAQKDMDLYHYTRDYFLKGKKKSETRILYSSASISRTLFNATCKAYSKSDLYMRRGFVTVDGVKYFRNVYTETWMRPGVHGGFNMVSDLGYKYEGDGIVLDVNSLYDYVACNEPLPLPRIEACGLGTPDVKWLDRDYHYTIMKVAVTAELKEDGIPCILGDGERFNGTGYLSKMNRRVLTLTPSDRDLLFDNYKVSYYRIKSYMVFTCSDRKFKRFIAPLYEKKRTLPKGPERDFVKSMLVGFLGTFGRRVYKYEYVTETREDGNLYRARYNLTAQEYKTELKKCSGLAFVSAAITSSARKYIITWIKKCKDRFLYTDTDSIHLAGKEIPDFIPISDKLGEFKVEHTFSKCIYKGVKKYIFIEDGKIIPTIAGVPKDTFDRIDQVKCHAVDYEKIHKYMRTQKISALFDCNLPIKNIVEDIETQTVAYHSAPVFMGAKKEPAEKILTPEQKEAQRIKEWRDNREFYKNLSLHYGQKKREHDEYKVKLKRVYAILDLIKSGLLSGDSPWISDLEPWQKTILDELTFENGIFFY